MKEIDYSTIQLDNIDTMDYPDFSDAFICYAEYTDGTPLSDDDLDRLNNNTDLVHELAHESYQ